MGRRERITSRANALAREAHALLTAGGRREQGAFLVEGVKLIRDALDAGFRPRRVFVAPDVVERRPGGRELLAVLDPAATAEATPQVIEWLADTENSQGVVAVFEKRDVRSGPGHVVLVLDGLQDPGNVGTILRSAVACGLVTTVVVRGGADPFGPKAVRASSGAVFRVRLGDLPSERPIWLADMAGELRYDRVDWRTPCTLVVGSEASGASDEMKARLAGRISIPLRGPVESLNAAMAASILLFEAARQVAWSPSE